MSPMYYRRHFYRLMCLTLSLYILGTKPGVICDVYACLRKAFKEVCLSSEPLLACDIMISVMEQNNDHVKEIVSIENIQLNRFVEVK
jgi:hypothetical protein